MTQHPVPDPLHTRALWTVFSRTVRPSYGARCNAADALREAQDTRRHRAETAAALSASRASAPPGAATGPGAHGRVP